ncbi:SpoIIE family protein phosphatase [Streptomyces zagrosensis]|uniref:PAS domain-containing protein/anti-sigma regulatory factor (Ser/Thr protein kinase) n=1 Tax=Streptomyces zagrosensis TaxID=1042984 RepID=A0A7W9Q525_9ACTN|nr:SpoIIE family protein phosphatase [Streptomyces zagrosensis]MBB5933746.1 PAS domain-containing protein/anti-sigma regulatory factor (Ser/Thr protein kinase) [Streptomyces zagrosensis]
MKLTRWSVRFPGSQRRTGRGDHAARTPSAGSGSVPAARGERGEPGPAADTSSDASSDTGDIPTLEELSLQTLLTQVPAPVAIVYGPDHRIAYVNDAYAALFGTRSPGLTAREALPELQEMGVLPLMDQVLRSGKPRTVKSRRVPHGGAKPPAPSGAPAADPPHRGQHSAARPAAGAGALANAHHPPTPPSAASPHTRSTGQGTSPQRDATPERSAATSQAPRPTTPTVPTAPTAQGALGGASSGGPAVGELADPVADPIREAAADPLMDLATEGVRHIDLAIDPETGGFGMPEPQDVEVARLGAALPGVARHESAAMPVAGLAPGTRTRDSYYTFTCTPIRVAPSITTAHEHLETAWAPATTQPSDTHSTAHPNPTATTGNGDVGMHDVSRDGAGRDNAGRDGAQDRADGERAGNGHSVEARAVGGRTGADTTPNAGPPSSTPAPAPGDLIVGVPDGRSTLCAPDTTEPCDALPESSPTGTAPSATRAPAAATPSTNALSTNAPETNVPAANTPATNDPSANTPVVTSAPAAALAPAAVTAVTADRHQQPAAFYRGVLVYAADVTDQVEAVERLRVSERRQREAAVTLQRSLLPQELEQPDDLRVAATYQPGGTDAAVGGDWYDVITLGAGRTALVIGDVMGRGLRAAAVMGQLRTAVRAYARLDLPPHEVLQLLDGLAAEIDASQIATCVYAVHDPNEGRLLYASAGHLPILVRDPDGTVRRAAEPTGPPLGTGGWQHASSSMPLGPGSSAVLYTDGLVERRDQDIDDGVAELERAFAGATGSPQVMCDRLIRALGITAEHDDDVAVLVLQHPARTGHDAELFHNAALELLGGIEAAPRARAFASGVLASWRFPTELRDLGVLAASELVANSLQHGTPPMRLRLRRTDRRLIIEVTDGDDHLPRRRRAEPVDEAGRGISIIATIASSWGSRRTPDGGKAVWCEFALPRT